MNQLIPVPHIQKLIQLIRGRKVMLDRDLARLYGVHSSQLNRAVKRNTHRFPADFMFRLSHDENESLRRTFGITCINFKKTAGKV